MKIVVVGGTGLIGSNLVSGLMRAGEAVLAASPSNGVDAFTGTRLTEALAGADIVVDASNPPLVDGGSAHDYFTRSTANLLEAGLEAGVRHHIVLSIVGADRAPADGYMVAKGAQEQLVLGSVLPHTVLRATQFFEFAEQIADWNTTQDTIRLPATRMRPVASDDVVSALMGLVRSGPVEPVLEVGGPEEVGLDEFVRRVLLLHHDPRYILADPAASPIGFNLQADVLLPAAGFRAADTTLAAWIESRRVHERVNARTR